MIRRTSWTVPEGCTCFPSREDLSPERLRRAEELAFQYGESYDSYLLVDSGRQYFFGRQDEGVLGFTTWRRQVYVVGGLLAPRRRKRALLREFLEFAALNGLEVCFLNVLKSDVDLFRSEGFQVSKVGEEPLVDLRTATWQGNEFAWIRRQENFCRRSGVRFEEVVPDPDCPRFRTEIAPELLDVSTAHLQATVYGRELSLVVGRLEVNAMFRKRVFVARRDGQIEAFVISNPACDGRLWSVETYRRRPTATRGVIAFMILQIARQLQEEGHPFLSLCQVPGLRVHVGAPSDSRFVVNGLRFWWNRLPWFYDVPRQYHFKSRFRPQYREQFMAAHPRSRFIPMLAFFFKWGIIRPDFTRLPLQMLKRMRKWSNTEVLANPDEEHYSLIDDLVALLDEPGRDAPRVGPDIPESVRRAAVENPLSEPV